MYVHMRAVIGGLPIFCKGGKITPIVIVVPFISRRANQLSEFVGRLAGLLYRDKESAFSPRGCVVCDYITRDDARVPALVRDHSIYFGFSVSFLFEK